MGQHWSCSLCLKGHHSLWWSLKSSMKPRMTKYRVKLMYVLAGHRSYFWFTITLLLQKQRRESCINLKPSNSKVKSLSIFITLKLLFMLKVVVSMFCACLELIIQANSAIHTLRWVLWNPWADQTKFCVSLQAKWNKCAWLRWPLGKLTLL